MAAKRFVIAGDEHAKTQLLRIPVNMQNSVINKVFRDILIRCVN